MLQTDSHIIAASLAETYIQGNKSICYIAENNSEARLLSHELSLYIDSDLINYFPEREILPFDHFSSPESIIKDRFKILNKENNSPNIVVTSSKNLFERYPSKSFFRSLQSFNIGESIALDKFKKILTDNHFLHTDKVDTINKFSSRGGVLDIWPSIYQNPIRIEFFDEEIESIRSFDPSSQLTITKINQFNLTTGSSLPLDDGGVKKFRDNWRDYFPNNDERVCDLFNDLNNKSLAEGYEIYLPLFFEETESFNNLFKNYEFISANKVYEENKKYWQEINRRFDEENIDASRPLLQPEHLFFNLKHVENFINTCGNLKIEESNYKKLDAELGFEENLDIAKKLLNDAAINKIITSSLVPSEYENLKKINLSSINEISKISDSVNGLNLISTEIFRPLYNVSIKTIFLHREYFENDAPINQNINAPTNIRIDTNIHFNFNDYVIHENYGLGVYKGLEVVESKGIKNEYLKISYANNENLYVPLAKTFLISKYHKNSEKIDTTLDSLSNNKWSQKKQRAEKRAYDHAAEILDIESRRLSSHAPALRIDASSYKEFIKEFPYKETNDQLVAIEAIEKDLSLIKPMNRLLCGDVGFGKTEIAMRAAFISVNANKQVVILAPSTVLVSQHFQSFVDRFKKFGITIKSLNRHSSSSEKVKTISDFNNAKVDILIGTHALFTQALDFQNLGLLVVDEEHRFGTKQKDIIKSKKPDVHVLYLSATPIPRTMNFIFAGLKDFSFLHTPPTNRLSIKSFLKVETDNLMIEAIKRENSRDGQCFIIQNDIKKLSILKDHLLLLLPDLKIEIAHGQLKKTEITKTMNLFQLGKIDVLLCTTIVEMGLDIPNANTMIILDAYNFGLAQLHQLRGRVGRSSKQGYCYFLIPTPDLPKSSRERLDSIIRLSDLGSGFFIAQEDLELRGGGEILGEKQSGHVDAIGISLYLSMLKDSIEGIKNPSREYKSVNSEINFFDDAFIPDMYLPSPTERLKVYRRINEVTKIAELFKLKIELIDRCGKYIDEVDALFSNAELLILSSSIGISKISSHSDKTSIQFDSKLDDNILSKVLNIIRANPKIYQMEPSGKLNMFIEDSENSNQRRLFVRNFINEIS